MPKRAVTITLIALSLTASAMTMMLTTVGNEAAPAQHASNHTRQMNRFSALLKAIQ